MELCVRQIRFGRRTQPADRLALIATSARTHVIERRQIALRYGITLLRGSEIPSKGFGRIVLNAQTILIERSQIILGASVMLHSGGLVILKRRCNRAQRLPHVRTPEHKFGVGIILSRGSAQPLQSMLDLL